MITVCKNQLDVLLKKAKVVVSCIDKQWDLADMSSLSKFNKSIKFLQVVIDIFSRFVWV